jgi:hypothetical protein
MAYKSTINTGLPNIADPPDPLFFAEFTRVYNAIRNLTLAIDLYTGTMAPDPTTTPANSVLVQNSLRVFSTFNEDVAYGQMVNLYDSGGGVLAARLASAAVAGLVCRGWCAEAGGVLTGATGQIKLGGICTAISGLVPGDTYYLSNTPGGIAATAGTVGQIVGFALGTTTLFTWPGLYQGSGGGGGSGLTSVSTDTTLTGNGTSGSPLGVKKTAPVTKTADFTLAATENWVINNKAASSCTVTLPAAASYVGREVTFKNMQAFTLVSASADVTPIDSVTAGNAILSGVIGNWATLVSDGTNWVIMQQAPNNVLLLE